MQVLLILPFCGLKAPTFPSVGGLLIVVTECVLVQSGPAKALAFSFSEKNYSRGMSAPGGISVRLCVFYPDTRGPAELSEHTGFPASVAVCRVFAVSFSSTGNSHFGGII